MGHVGDVEVVGEFLFGCFMNLSLFHMMVLLPFYLFRDYDFWSLHIITHTRASENSIGTLGEGRG